MVPDVGALPAPATAFTEPVAEVAAFCRRSICFSASARRSVSFLNSSARRLIGWESTLIPTEASLKKVVKGKVIKSRDVDATYLASGAEMLQAALFQNEHPSPCRRSIPRC